MKKTSIIAVTALVAGFGLVGCGGGGSASGSTETTVQGTAVDPELVGATVCLDINNNGECETTEPSVKTDMNGTYSMTVSQDDMIAGATLLVQGGYDRVTKMPFTGTMTAMIDEANLAAQQMITPLTTLVYETAMAADMNMTAAQERVASVLGLTVEELQANMLELEDQGALQAAMALQQAAELATDTNDTRAFYRAIAEEMSVPEIDLLEVGGSTLGTLIATIADQNLSGVEQLRVQYFAEAMDVMNVISDSELYAMSVERMQEMIADMNISGITGELETDYELVSNFVDAIMVLSPDDVEVYVTEHLLEAAGVAQELIDPVTEVIIANAEITVDTAFGMMSEIMVQNETEIKTKLVDTLDYSEAEAQTKYDEMVLKLETMEAAFAPAS